MTRFKHYNICIGDQYFEVTGRSEDAEIVKDEYLVNNPLAIYKFYKSPSSRKSAIWEEWCDWAVQNNARIIISGGNHNFFTIYGTIWTDEHVYAIRITARHQTAKIIS